ncbi:cupin domain-containing protein [Candidatus Saccharibacteria bacterium]|nr:cupin domain-containing protein [Candidatus Saccharibacteria bacterium]
MHIQNLKQKTLDNTTFRTVLANGKNTQVVVMDVKPGEDIGKEVHPDNDQVLYLVSGKGTVYLSGQESEFNPGDCVLVPAGTEHNFTTVGNQPMKIITTYSPPHHPEGTVHTTKADAEAAEAGKH